MGKSVYTFSAAFYSAFEIEVKKQSIPFKVKRLVFTECNIDKQFLS